jgi:undecaprenyl-diphosphatase
MILIVRKASQAIGDNEKTYDILTLVGILVVVAVLIYVQVKPYPMDYVDGKLLVDPQKMMNDCFKACGAFLGLLLGSYVERHYIHYEIPVGYKNLPIQAGVSVALLFIWKAYFEKATIIPALGGHWGNLISRFGIAFIALTLIPYLIMKSAREYQQTAA